MEIRSGSCIIPVIYKLPRSLMHDKILIDNIRELIRLVESVSEKVDKIQKDLTELKKNLIKKPSK
jgi:hypothetical protein